MYQQSNVFAKTSITTLLPEVRCWHQYLLCQYLLMKVKCGLM